METSKAETPTIASAVGAERLREMMADDFGRAATSTRRYGGTVNQFTGDGIMAVFGAPVALEDHAFRACLAALAIQEQMAQLAGEVQRCDGVVLRLRVGLNSGRVIAGEIGSGPTGTPQSASRSGWHNGWNRSPHPAGCCSPSPLRGWSNTPPCWGRPSGYT